MEGFEWAQNNLAVETPQDLEAKGVRVYTAPNIPSDVKVVNLANGQVNWFEEREDRPEHGYFADFDAFVHFARESGTPFSETNGQVSLQPIGFKEAGDPLRHGGS